MHNNTANCAPFHLLNQNIIISSWGECWDTPLQLSLFCTVVLFAVPNWTLSEMQLFQNVKAILQPPPSGSATCSPESLRALYVGVWKTLIACKYADPEFNFSNYSLLSVMQFFLLFFLTLTCILWIFSNILQVINFRFSYECIYMSDLMWHETERGGRFVHSVIAAAGHCIASEGGEKGHKFIFLHTCLCNFGSF